MKPKLFAIAFAASIFSACHLFAQTGPRLMLELWPKEETIQASADARVFDDGYVKDSDEDFDFAIYQTEGRLRIFPGQLASPRIGWEFLIFDIDSPGLPGELVDYSIAGATPIGKWEEWIFGLSLGVGYAGAAPFGDGNAWYGQGTLAAFRQLGKNDAVVFVIDYDGNRPFYPDIPLPGIAYTRRISDQLLLVVGLPVCSLEWKPIDRLEVDLLYSLGSTFDASIGYEIVKHWRVLASFQNEREAFFLDGLEHGDDRLLFEQRRAELGVRWEPREGFAFSLAAGYAMGGELSAGFDARESDLVADLSDEPYVHGGFEVRF